MRHFLAFTLCLTLAMGASTSVFAHSKIAKSVPADGKVIKPGLSQITLGFTKPVRIMLVKVRNTATKADVKTDLKPASTFAKSLTFPVAPLQPGAHSVTWTAVAKDGHVMKGTLKFSVKE